MTGTKLLFLCLIGVLIASCVTPSTLLVNNEGKVIRCASYGYGYGIAGAIAVGTAESIHSSCVRDAERLGFAPLPTITTGINLDLKTRPLVVSSVTGPAAQAGILKGDVLTNVDGEEITQPVTLIKIINAKRAGDQVRVRVNRGGESLDFDVRMVERDDHGSPATSGTAQASPPPTITSPTPKSPTTPTTTASTTSPLSNAPVTAPAGATPGRTISLTPISLINRAGSTVSCPPESSDSWGLSCVGNAESQGFVRIPDVSAGMSLDWNSKPVKIIQVNGTASEAGVRAGDLLLEFDGNKISEPIMIFKIVGKKQAGDYIIVKIVRGGKPMDFTYRLMPK